MVQIVAAHAICGTPEHHIIPVVKQLHWLPYIFYISDVVAAALSYIKKYYLLN